MNLPPPIVSLAVFMAFLFSESVFADPAKLAVSESSSGSRTGSFYPLLAVGVLLVFLLSALCFIILETRREERDKRNRRNH